MLFRIAQFGLRSNQRGRESHVSEAVHGDGVPSRARDDGIDSRTIFQRAGLVK